MHYEYVIKCKKYLNALKLVAESKYYKAIFMIWPDNNNQIDFIYPVIETKCPIIDPEIDFSYKFSTQEIGAFIKPLKYNAQNSEKLEEAFELQRIAYNTCEDLLEITKKYYEDYANININIDNIEWPKKE